MKTLDLFCGTKSFSKIADKHGYETHTLDILDKFNPTYLTDIMEWDYKQFPPGYFDIIWASPNCKDYSSLNFFCGDKDLTHSNNLIKRVLEIIEYYNPQYWYMENPQTGKLKDQDFMVGLPFNDIDYCKYGYDYRKRTRVWNNNENWDGNALCRKGSYCNSRVNRKHTGWNSWDFDRTKRKIIKWEDRISIPPALMEEIIIASSA